MNHITIELCAEDRARLAHLATAVDKLTAALEQISVQAVTAEPAEPDEVQQALTEVLAKAETATAPTEEPAKVETPTAEETPTEPTETSEAPAEAPKVTLEQIQQKVVQLCAASADKKAQVRAIITAYAPTVTALEDHPDKWAEIWAQLTALEG